MKPFFILAICLLFVITAAMTIDAAWTATPTVTLTPTPDYYVYLPVVAKNHRGDQRNVEGYVFFDMNGDNIWQPDVERVIPGAEICLDQTCVISGEDGTYSITIPNGDYDLRIDPHNETRPLDERFYYLNVSPSEPPFVGINTTIPFNVDGDLDNNFGLWQGYLIFPILEEEEGYMHIFNLPDTHAGDLVRDFNGNESEDFQGMMVPVSNNHFAIDIDASVGSPIFAAAWGKVIDAGIGHEADLCTDPNDASIAIIHPNGNISSYHHLQDMYVSKGDIVEAGELIGTSGDNFGNMPNPHLHFDVIRGVPPEYFDIINDFTEQVQHPENPYGFHLQYEGLFRNVFPPDEYTEAGNFISSDEYSLWISEFSLQDTPLMLHNGVLTTLGEYSDLIN